MPLVFSPLSEDVLSHAPRKLLPKHAFLMRQIGKPPAIDTKLSDMVRGVFRKKGFKSIDASDTAGQNDYLERILGLIRSTAFTVAIFSHETRAESLANIALELGFAAMCGKPLMIVKSEAAKAPSDLSRTDWIVFEDGKEDAFKKKVTQATDEILALIAFERMQLDVALDAPSIDCAAALEKVTKAFLLSGEARFIDNAKQIFDRLTKAPALDVVNDLIRVRSEANLFIRQAEAAMEATRPRSKKRKNPGFVSTAIIEAL